MIVVSTHDARLVPIADRVVHMAEDAARRDAEPVAVAYAAGETVFRQGDRSDLVYMVDAGEVDVVRVLADGGEELLATVGPGHYVGELGPMLGFPRSATVRARTRGASDRLRRAPVPARLLVERNGDSVSGRVP